MVLGLGIQGLEFWVQRFGLTSRWPREFKRGFGGESGCF